MRRNLIELILLLLLPLQLLASTYEWKTEINKTTVYKNEAIYLKYSCEFSDRAELYSIDFNPVTKNENYTIILLSEKTKVRDLKRTDSYEYVVFVHKAGQITFDFDITMKKTNEDSIENTVIGRDNEEYEEFTPRYIKQKAIDITVKDTNRTLVGDFVTKIQKDRLNVKAYEPYHLEILLKGIANFSDLKPFVFNIEGVKVFSQEPTRKIKLTQNGYEGEWSQKFAFVSEKDFKIPKLSIKYFDLHEKRVKEFIYRGDEIEVSKGYKREELLDIEESSDESSGNFIYYLLTFISGFLVSKIDIKRYYDFKRFKPKKKPFEKKIDSLKTVEEIAFTLALYDAKRYKEIIQKIENRDIVSLKEAKRLIDY